MVKHLFFGLIMCIATMSQAQNVQLHYDFLKDARDTKASGRGYLTSTIEMFHPDKSGSTFFFTDMDYNGDKGSVSLAYMEITRDQKICKKFPLLAHFEYNGGLITEKNNFGLSFDNAFLLGFSYPFKIGDASFSVYGAYKGIRNTTEGPDFQLTGTWFAMLAKGKITLSGFIDIWSQDKFGATGRDGKHIVLLTEPQIWYNFTKNFSAGSEIEISNNFVTKSEKLEIFPTAALKYTF